MKKIDKRLDDIYSIFIRLRDTDEYGFGECFVTGDKVNYHDADCGHFISRKHHQFRWSAENSHIQSRTSNRFDNPNHMYNLYRIKMIDKYGLGKVELMEKQAKFDTKMMDFEKEKLYSYYRRACKDLLKNKMFPVNLP